MGSREFYRNFEGGFQGVSGVLSEFRGSLELRGTGS